VKLAQNVQQVYREAAEVIEATRTATISTTRLATTLSRLSRRLLGSRATRR
jgi:hypothetical protein